MMAILLRQAHASYVHFRRKWEAQILAMDGVWTPC